MNAISPGPIADTEGFSKLSGVEDKSNAGLETYGPLQKFGAKTDISSMALFLASDAAKWITG